MSDGDGKEWEARYANQCVLLASLLVAAAFLLIAVVTKKLAWMQAVIGQFYLAALVARLVGMLPRDSIASK